jgi:hypothetical protein
MAADPITAPPDAPSPTESGAPLRITIYKYPQPNSRG